MGLNVDYTARKWTDDDLRQAIETAHWAGVMEERRRVLAAYGQLRADWVPRAVRTWEEMRAERVALMERAVADHVPDARCAGGRRCALCIARIPVVQTPDWPAITMPGAVA